MADALRVPLGPVEAFRDCPVQVTVESQVLFIVRHEQGFRALSNVCPHQGGFVYDEGTCFECPQHGWRFDRSTGRCLNAPSRTLAVFPVTVEDEVLHVQLPRYARSERVRQDTRATKPGLTIQLLSHACLKISYRGFTLLTDPWLDGPAFLGAWAPYPPHNTTGADLRPEAILITHEHSDHFHERTMRHFDRGTPVYVPDFPNQRLPRRLAALGFRHVQPLRFGDVTTIAEGWRITPFEPASYWNDAFLLIDIDGFRLFNVNDAGVNTRIARMVAPVDLVAVQFSTGASGYPWTWSHLSDTEKATLSARSCAGQLRLMRDAVALYGASSLLPFAAHFTLWHPEHRRYARLMKRNSFADLKAALDDSGVDVIDLLPGDSWDAGDRRIERASEPDARGVDFERLETYMRTAVSEAMFAAVHPSDEGLSYDELVNYLLRLNDVPEIAHCEALTVRIVATTTQTLRQGLDVSFSIGSDGLTILSTPLQRPNINVAIPLAILTAIVREGISWDEAIIGCWCRFDRHPNVYHAGFWRLLQAPYLRRPVEMPSPEGAGGISSASTVAEVLETYGAPADRILRRYGLYCSGCHHSTAESIGMAARQHGVDLQHAEMLVKELNRALVDDRSPGDAPPKL